MPVRTNPDAPPASERKWHRRLKRLQLSLREARLDARWEKMLRERAEEALRDVAALEPRLASSGLRAGDWHVGRDAVGRAAQGAKDLKLMRRHKDRLLADEPPLPDED